MSNELSRAIEEQEKLQKEKDRLEAEKQIIYDDQLEKTNDHIQVLRRVLNEKYDSKIGIKCGLFGSYIAHYGRIPMVCGDFKFYYNGNDLDGANRWDIKTKQDGIESESSHGYHFSATTETTTYKFFVAHFKGYGIVEKSIRHNIRSPRDRPEEHYYMTDFYLSVDNLMPVLEKKLVSAVLNMR